MSAKQKYLVLAAIALTVALAAALFLFSVLQKNDYGGIFVCGVNQAGTLLR